MIKRRERILTRVVTTGAAIKAVDDNMTSSYAPFRDTERATCRDGEDHQWCVTGLGIRELDTVLRADFDPQDAEARVADVLRDFRAAAPAGGGWWVGPLSRPVDLPAHLERAGLPLSSEQVGMALDLSRPRPPPNSPVPDFNVEPVRDGPRFDAWMDAFADAFGFDADARAKWADAYSVAARHPGYRHYAGVVNDRVVATASLVLDDASAGLYNVGTVPDYRRRGFAGALLHGVLAEARNAGAPVAVLHAAPVGVSVYRRLGFEPVCTILEYQVPPA